MSDDMKFGVSFTVLCFVGCSFVVGLFSAMDRNSVNQRPYLPEWNCKPNSIHTMINLPLRAGCELTKRRCWNNPNDTCEVKQWKKP